MSPASRFAPTLEARDGAPAIVTQPFDRIGPIVVGSSSTCDVRLRAPGVRARHLVLVWDGRELWIERIVEAGSVRVDGRIVEPPAPLRGTTELGIGAAILVASVPAADCDVTVEVPTGTGFHAPETETELTEPFPTVAMRVWRRHGLGEHAARGVARLRTLPRQAVTAAFVAVLVLATVMVTLARSVR